MANGHQHINYTAADFERYYNGSMPDAEMYALEKAALEDPFLADALEGYEFTTTPSEDILELASQIPPAKEEKKKAVVVSFKTMWLRVAAVLVLTFGIGYMVLKTDHSNEPVQKLAVNDNQTFISPAENNYKTLPADTTTSTSTVIANGHSTEDKATLPSSNGTVQTVRGTFKQTQAAAPSSNDYAYTPSVAEDAKLKQQEKDASVAKEKSESELVKRMYKKPGEKYFLEGKVTDDDGTPVPFATISGSNNTVTTTDANGDFRLQYPDSLMLANISATGYAAVNQNFNLNNQQNITLRKENNNLSEVVVTGAGVQRSKKDLGYSTKAVSSDQIKGKASGVNIQPVDGMARYDQYIDSARSRSLPAKAAHGEVSLSFKVNKKGEPIAIKVEKSLSPAQDAEATRLLKEGPKWQYSHGRRAFKSFTF